MKLILLIAFFGSFCSAKSQQIESIHVNLYTDSLKKGTYNYINVDGLFSNGKYLPLDSSQLIFSSSYGKFHGNSLWIDKECKEKKVLIKVVMRANPAVTKNFDMYVKINEDTERLPSSDELMKEMKQKKRGSKSLE